MTSRANEQLAQIARRTVQLRFVLVKEGGEMHQKWIKIIKKRKSEKRLFHTDLAIVTNDKNFPLFIYWFAWQSNILYSLYFCIFLAFLNCIFVSSQLFSFVFVLFWLFYYYCYCYFYFFGFVDRSHPVVRTPHPEPTFLEHPPRASNFGDV